MATSEIRQRCLVFAGKDVGKACLKFMIDRGADEICAVFTGSAADEGILQMARSAGILTEPCSPEVLRRLVAGTDRYDWIINLWCPHLLPEAVLDLARRRLNVHPGLVPHCRGNDAAAWALRRDLPAGVSLIEMTADIDAGGVYAQRPVLRIAGERGRALHVRLQDEAVRLFEDEWPRIAGTVAPPASQEPGGSYFTRAMTERDRVRPASETWVLRDLVTWALAHDFSPGTTAEIQLDNGARYRVQVDRIEGTGP